MNKVFEKKFERRVENFHCSHCGNFVEGTGYTDHCPACLWSKHVDINPGDRKENCGGMMEPIGVETKGDGYIIYYKCLDCNYPHRVKSSPDDNFDEILKLSHRPIKN
jgi:rubrerythrin